ncbi:phosphatidylinositol-glycan biosynthesis class F protein-like [Oppia nitens]|uniref:phosphatidylinositol-glycan biosynthesis class F protein-like n=1 Tax=Oppia nitens TaxID=1686743 RepID=UPI0023DC51D1|nr:phosphatidylinositol-glycan biosynthesis class F protein-like [Oppia nitens]
MTNNKVIVLLPYNLCQLVCVLYMIVKLSITQLNPSQHLPTALLISYGFQSIALLISHSKIVINSQSLLSLDVIPKVITLIKSIAIYYVLSVLLGAPLLSDKLNTLYLALLLTSLTTLPIVVLCRSDKILSNLINSLYSNKLDARVDTIVFRISLITLIGGWFGAFPIVLDWMQPWQQWPISVCLGAMFANFIANSISLCFGCYKLSFKL